VVPKFLYLGKLIGADSETLAMEHLPNRNRAMGSNSTLVHFYYLGYFSDLRFLLTRIIIRLALRNPQVGVERITLRGMVDSKNGTLLLTYSTDV
jgi:hypothetical protein